MTKRGIAVKGARSSIAIGVEVMRKCHDAVADRDGHTPRVLGWRRDSSRGRGRRLTRRLRSGFQERFFELLLSRLDTYCHEGSSARSARL